MKKITLALFCAFVLFSAPLHAEVKSIVDWDGGNNPYKPGKDTIAGTDNLANLKTTCSNSLPQPTASPPPLVRKGRFWYIVRHAAADTTICAAIKKPKMSRPTMIF